MAAGGHGPLWLHSIPGLHDVPIHVLSTGFVALLLVSCTCLARLQLARVTRSPEGGLVPPSRLSFLNIFEILAEKLYGMTEGVLGKEDAKTYFPFIGTVFLFIFAQNLLGLFPLNLPPTENFNTTLAMGAFVFLYYNYVGIKANGWGYLKHFTGPVLLLAPLFVVIEVISHLVRPLTLGLRLRGNISGDHLILGVFSELAPYGVPVIFMGFGLFVSFVQAFVFSLLTMVYISLAKAHDH